MTFNCLETSSGNYHVIVNDNSVHDSESIFNIDNTEGNVEHDQEFIYKNVRIKVDTESQVNIIPEILYNASL